MSQTAEALKDVPQPAPQDPEAEATDQETAPQDAAPDIKDPESAPKDAAPEQEETRLSRLNAYLATGIHDVDGWCIPHLWQTIWPLASHIGDGPIAEIGVFEGKFFTGLCKTFGQEDGQKAIAIDVFDMQEFNLDKAGVGKKDVLLQNLARNGISPDGVTCIEADSISLKSRDARRFVDTHGLMKFFSVDGCHEVTHTMLDVEFAMEVTAHDGIIAVDDYSNINWPGVSEAIARIYLNRNPAFIPLAVTCNKLLLCSLSYHQTYLGLIEAYITKKHRNSKLKPNVRFGYDTWSVTPFMGAQKQKKIPHWQDLRETETP